MPTVNGNTMHPFQDGFNKGRPSWGGAKPEITTYDRQELDLETAITGEVDSRLASARRLKENFRSPVLTGLGSWGNYALRAQSRGFFGEGRHMWKGDVKMRYIKAKTICFPWKRSWLIMISAGIVFYTGACGGNGGSSTEQEAASTAKPTSQAESAPDVCGLLNQAKIASEVGNAVDQGERQGVATCQWNGDEMKDVNVTLTVSYLASNPKRACSGSREVSEESGPIEEISGLGNEAWWQFSGSGAFTSGEMTVCLDRGIAIIILAGDRSEADLRGAAERLMAEVLKGL